MTSVEARTEPLNRLLRGELAAVETYRQADGSVRIPDVLKPYMRGAEVIAPHDRR